MGLAPVGHGIALDSAALARAAVGRPHRRKEHIPLGPPKPLLYNLIQLQDNGSTIAGSSAASTDSTVIDLSACERAAQKRTLQ